MRCISAGWESLSRHMAHRKSAPPVPLPRAQNDTRHHCQARLDLPSGGSGREGEAMNSDIGEKLQAALAEANADIAEAILKRDNLLDAWEKRDYEWLFLAGYIGHLELEALEREALH